MAAVLALAGGLGSAAQAADINAQRELINSGIVGVMGGSVSGTSANLVWDMAVALDDGYELRVLPMMGKGSVRSIEDLLLLRGVDIAIVQSDVLDFYKRTNIYSDIDSRVGYIAQLYNEELHLLTRTDITSIDQLNGKKVNFGPDSSGSFMTASIVFDQLGITAEITDDSFQEALAKLRSGEIDGWFRVAGAPTSLVSELKKTDGVHLIAIPGDRLSAAYNRVTFTSEMYPELIEPGQSVETVAVGAVMAAYNWPANHARYQKVQRFINALEANIDKLKSSDSFHPKWKEVDLAAEIGGWRRIARGGANGSLTQ
jgi:TRAP transporter TAXI family solute receptor